MDTAASAADARAAISSLGPDVVLMDRQLPDADGTELMVSLREAHPATQFIMVTAHGSIRSAVESTQSGAVDYLTKPVEPDVLVLTVANALRRLAIDAEVQHLRSRNRYFAQINGHSDPPYPSVAMRETMELAGRAARQEGIILLLGEQWQRKGLSGSVMRSSGGSQRTGDRWPSNSSRSHSLGWFGVRPVPMSESVSTL